MFDSMNEFEAGLAMTDVGTDPNTGRQHQYFIMAVKREGDDTPITVYALCLGCNAFHVCDEGRDLLSQLVLTGIIPPPMIAETLMREHFLPVAVQEICDNGDADKMIRNIHPVIRAVDPALFALAVPLPEDAVRMDRIPTPFQFSLN